MKLHSILASACLLGIAQSVDVSLYAPGAGVESGFKAYLKELYAQAEDPASTTTFTNMFTSNGQLIVVGTTATGATEIVALKQKLLPTAGNKHWNHLPNVTTVYSDTDAQKVYQVLGIIDTTYDGGNCSRAYYTSRFAVAKTGGVLDFTPHTGNLAMYNDLVVSPGVSPTDIPCS